MDVMTLDRDNFLKEAVNGNLTSRQLEVWIERAQKEAPADVEYVMVNFVAKLNDFKYLTRVTKHRTIDLLRVLAPEDAKAVWKAFHEWPTKARIRNYAQYDYNEDPEDQSTIQFLNSLEL